MFEPEVFRKQMHCIEESTRDIVGTPRRPLQSLGAPCSDSAPPRIWWFGRNAFGDSAEIVSREHESELMSSLQAACKKPYGSDGNLLFGKKQMCKCMLSDLRQRWSTPIFILRPYTIYRYLSIYLTPDLSSSFASWSIPASLYLICHLQSSKYSFLWAWVYCGTRLRWGVWKVRKGDASIAATYCWKALNAMFLSLVNLLSFNYKRQNQKKADNTVDSFDRTFSKLKLIKRSSMLQEGITNLTLISMKENSFHSM